MKNLSWMAVVGDVTSQPESRQYSNLNQNGVYFCDLKLISPKYRLLQQYVIIYC